MNLQRLRRLWRSILSRAHVSEREAAKMSGLPLHQVRDLVLPRRNTDVERELVQRVERLAAVLPVDEHDNLLRLVAAAQAGDLGAEVLDLQARLAELEKILADSNDNTPRTERRERLSDGVSKIADTLRPVIMVVATVI